MNGKKIALIGIIMLVVIGFVVAAGCTSAPAADSGDKWLTSTYNPGDGTAITKMKTSDKGELTMIVKTGDPVIGTYGATDGVAYQFFANGTAYRYLTDKEGKLYDKTERMWGKLDGATDTYVISGQNYGDGYYIYTYSAADETMTQQYADDPAILKKITISWDK